MINIIRIEKEPDCLAIEKQKEINGKTGKHDCGKDEYRIRTILKKDFLNKCYICESKGNTDFLIEHFKPHENGKYIDLKYDWNNLFFSCSYCNGKKSSSYNNCKENMILDCTNPEHDVENWIKYEKSIKLKSKFEISAIKKKQNKIVLKTVEFLDKIYNGNEQTKDNTENLNENVHWELFSFQKAIIDYLTKDNKDKYLKKIERKLSKKSAYTAFKRQIIKENKKYSEKFQHYFD